MSDPHAAAVDPLSASPAERASSPDAIDVLCIGPHPDDVELASAGLLLKSKAAGYRTGAIELTFGEMGTRGTVDKRKAELAEATSILGLDYRKTLGLPDGGVKASPDAIELLVRELRRLQPRIVVIPPKEDDDHPDHWHGSRLCWEAIHFAGKVRYLPDLPIGRRIGRILFAMYRRYYVPSLILDVTDVMPRCLDAIAVFHSQFGEDPADGGDLPETFISNPNFVHWWKSRRGMLGAMIGATYGEGYSVEGPLRIDDPIAMFGTYGNTNAIG